MNQNNINRHYRPKRSLAKVIFLQASVILLTEGGVVSNFFFGAGVSNFSGGVVSNFSGGVVSNFSGGWSPIFLGGLQFFGGSPIFRGGVLRNTVNVRPVRILLECILVIVNFALTVSQRDTNWTVLDSKWPQSESRSANKHFLCCLFVRYSLIESRKCNVWNKKGQKMPESGKVSLKDQGDFTVPHFLCEQILLVRFEIGQVKTKQLLKSAAWALISRVNVSISFPVLNPMTS